MMDEFNFNLDKRDVNIKAMREFAAEESRKAAAALESAGAASASS